MNHPFEIYVDEQAIGINKLEIKHQEERLPSVLFSIYEQHNFVGKIATLYYNHQPIATGKITQANRSLSYSRHHRTFQLEYNPKYPELNESFYHSAIETKEPHKFYFISQAQIMNYDLQDGTVYGSSLLTPP